MELSDIKLSVLIPARNEEWLAKTIENILENSEAETEVVAILDGELANPQIKQHDRVNVVYLPESIGQRAATNMAARLAKGKYVLKCDAHCAFDKGFDRKMLEMFAKEGDDITAVPLMKNLHVFDWVCKKCGNKWYQGPTPTKCFKDYKAREESGCDSTEFERDIKFHPKRRTPNSTSYRFDETMHFQYWNEYKRQQKEDYAETMSLQGSCFMLTKEKYWELDICEEKFGSWGQQGVEVALKTWLSGGRVLVNKKTWYAHLFRTQGGDFSFPYRQSSSQVSRARKYSRELFLGGKYKGKRDLRWLLDKFNPPEKDKLLAQLT